jgi:cell division protease FtsH
MTRFSRNNLFAFLLVLLFVVAFLNIGQIGRRGEVIDFRTFMEKVENDEIRDVTIKGQEFRGKTVNDTEFRTTGPRPEFLEPVYHSLVEHGVTPNFVESSDDSFWMTAIVTLVPVLGIGAVLIWFARNLQGANNRAMSFGKSRAKMLQESSRRITFSDVAGIDESKEELQEIVEFLKDPRKFTRLGGRIPKGVLLMGSPGTGKTLLAKAVAGEAGVPFFSISGSDFVEMFVGVGASRVRDLFEQAKKSAPCIIFIDEIDAVGRHRGAGLGGGHDEREQTLNQLLVEMDGFEGTEGVIVVAATNRPDVLDPALLRPGRFDRRVSVPNPDVKGRQQILMIHTRKIPVADGVDLSRVAKVTPGFSGADLENLCNEAALLAARRNKTQVDGADFEEARSKIYMGPERRSLVMPDAEKQKTAYHEAGHAIVAHLLPGHDPVHKVTIVPRGRALGVTWTLPEEDKLSQTREQLLQGITMAMGGRAAEEIMFNAVTGGAQSDLQRATQIARHMVCDLGMSDDLGPVAWDAGGNDEVFLGRQMNRVKNYSEATARRIDEEVRKILTRAYDAAKQMLQANKHVLDKVAASLIEHESLDAEQFASIVAAANPVSTDTAWWTQQPQPSGA